MEKTPLVSVIIPCHNSAVFIHRILDSLLVQTYSNMEIFTVDNDSKDNTAEVIKSYISKFEKKRLPSYLYPSRRPRTFGRDADGF